MGAQRSSFLGTGCPRAGRPKRREKKAKGASIQSNPKQSSQEAQLHPPGFRVLGITLSPYQRLLKLTRDAIARREAFLPRCASSLQLWTQRYPEKLESRRMELKFQGRLLRISSFLGLRSSPCFLFRCLGRPALAQLVPTSKETGSLGPRNQEFKINILSHERETSPFMPLEKKPSSLKKT